ncbi:MAG: hotdog fold thioesterase [Bacteroidetes bacterium]|nr:hotdog fold thioesterase [Bacteroidota bacterium]
MESIFFEPTNIKLEWLNTYCKNTMSDFLGIEYIELGVDFLKAKMPVNEKTVQPLRMLNGGASLALAECLGSLAANLVFDRTKWLALGLDLNGNHLRPVMEGAFVYGIAKPLQIGTTTQVWEIRVETEDGKLAHISRLTMAVKPRQ